MLPLFIQFLDSFPMYCSMLMRFFVFWFCFSFACSSALASDSRQRSLFLRTETALKEGNFSALADAESSLADYPLLPYLQYLYLSQHVGRSNEKELQRYLDRYDSTAFGADLRADWLRYLAHRDDAAGFLLFYRPQKDRDLQCHYLNVVRPGELDSAQKAEFLALWLTGDDLPASCSALEKRWVAVGERNEERVWQRLELAIEANNTGLINQLKKELPKPARAVADQWLRVHQHPDDLLKPLPATLADRHTAWLLADGLERLVWRDRDQGLQAWQVQNAEQALTAELRGRVIYTYALALATSGHANARDWLARIPAEKTDERIAGWRVVDAMRRWQWTEADFWLNQVPEKHRLDSRYRYFRARSQQVQTDPASAAPLFNELATQTDYYGFLARAQLGSMAKPQTKALAIDAELDKRMRQRDDIQRIQEWLLLGRQMMARREWFWATRSMSGTELQAAAVLANEWEWPERAVSALRQVNVYQPWELAYPLVHEDTMRSEAKKRRVDLGWAYAITRQESMFMSDAKSSAGALGLMQLMPSTAKITAQRFRVHYRGSQELVNPDTNIKLGVAHLSELSDINNGNLIYATAAYNAGQARVKNWVERDGHLPLDVWIETIPFRETQHYVKNVLAYSLIYSSRLSSSATAYEQISASLSRVPTNTAATLSIGSPH